MNRPIFWSLLFAVTVVFAAPVWAQTPAAPAFPYLGESTADNVNIRAGQSENFERLTQLYKYQQVVVAEEVFGWLKIQVPDETPVYIHAQYILKVNDTMGLVTGDRVNVRARPNVESSPIGQLAKSDQVKLLKQEGDWFKIAPDTNFYGWVKKDFITFKSQDITQMLKAPTESAPPQPAKVKKNSAKAEIKSTKSEASPAASASNGKLKVKGTLEAVEKEKNLPYDYKITDKGQLLYYLTGIDRGLDGFLHYDVEIEGSTVNSNANPSAPVFKVEKLQLIL